ncbi:MAG TPA: AAA family ATPase, partial [Thermoplasmata archaeon]|nr:AAA family ATPase [Thermoplasmata archaeon]
MLAKLILANFKPFRNFTIDFPELGLLVGKNNMGKSTLVDALRLISLEANYRLRREIVQIPEGVFDDDVHGYLVEPQRIPFPIANVHYEYGNEASYVTARFDHGVEISLAFAAPPASECYLAVRQDSVYLENVEAIRRRLRDISIAVLPPAAPFEEREDVLTRK